ncbi:MAG: hypothetical protein SGPRY_005059 [Prymnesium sp.]
MAGHEKRRIGGHVEWVGVILCAAICVAVVPRGKLLRAREAIVRTFDGSVTFGEYRSLVGLLELLRFIAQLPGDLNDAFYSTHGKEGESRDGPGATVHHTRLMREKLQTWLQVVLECAGALSTITFVTDAAHIMRAAHEIFLATSDATADGEGHPGIGGYIHGLYWRLALTPTLLPLMHITAWETMAAARAKMVARRHVGDQALLAERSDTALAPYVLAKRKSKSQDAQIILHELTLVPFRPPFASPATEAENRVLAVATAAFQPAFALGSAPLVQHNANQGVGTPDFAAQSVAYATPAHPTTLTSAETTARTIGEKLNHDRTPGRITASEDRLYELALAVESARYRGRNPRTGKKDDLAWRDFQEYARLQGFDPHLRAEWMVAHPDRESLKLAGCLIFVKPRSRASPAAKPMSIYYRYLALRRHFAPHVELPNPKLVRTVMYGLVQRFLKNYGITALRPQRAESMTMQIITKLVVNICVGSRKGESVLLPSDSDLRNCFTRDCLSWRIMGRVVSEPSAAQLLAIVKGQPFTAVTFHHLIDATLKNEIGGAARLYTPHSWRVGMASALKAAGASDAQIQAFGRWMSPDSVKIYEDALAPRAEDLTNRLQRLHSQVRMPLPLPRHSRNRLLVAPTPPPRTPASPVAARCKRTRRRRHARMAPTIDAGSATGVSRLDHHFPNDLNAYETFWQRQGPWHHPPHLLADCLLRALRRFPRSRPRREDGASRDWMASPHLPRTERV